MKIIYNYLLPIPPFEAMMTFGIILARKIFKPLEDYVINHECIHVAQAKEVGGYLIFYCMYLGQWIKYGYRNAPFEREARIYAYWPEYLENRESKAWKKYK